MNSGDALNVSEFQFMRLIYAPATIRVPRLTFISTLSNILSLATQRPAWLAQLWDFSRLLRPDHLLSTSSPPLRAQLRSGSFPHYAPVRLLVRPRPPDQLIPRLLVQEPCLRSRDFSLAPCSFSRFLIQPALRVESFKKTVSKPPTAAASADIRPRFPIVVPPSVLYPLARRFELASTTTIGSESLMLLGRSGTPGTSGTSGTSNLNLLHHRG
ncbi:hypothetical protein P175DRAFT_0529979 [Aspergillus ochraceoroseus IBT 24754]|uniref:Uncharacterized protein n=1 Tax=Aspergillus ochraceoroseus IBT 24754 TaxID=1392256 RepID=A0A2T5M2X9_9EURO|nr:uncharacterized protein P175DRAFT_0529979 [Aspergillus ochraceoroseus IBT 24754]PTU22893.1 hypothetical protein P175DRAFT_0529979 [Aspergillus ochraceoroseus IBT 24754]